MKVISLKCPDCGATFDLDKEREVCFCSYCGHKILLDKEQQEITYRTIDEAKIKELEYTYKKEEIERKLATKKKKTIYKTKLILFCIWVIAVIILWFLSNSTLDVAGFSPYHLILIPVLIFGIVIIIKEIKKFFRNN